MVDPQAPLDPVPLSAQEEAAWRALARAVLVIPRVLDADLLRSHGINRTEYTVLMNLSEAPGGSLRMSDLANYVAISVSGLTRVVMRLEREGRVEPFGGVQARRGGGARHFLVGWFDAIEFNGVDFITRRTPPADRLAALAAAVTPLRRHVCVAPWRRVAHADVATLADLFARSRGVRQEGLVLKAAGLAYVPNARGWGKLKHNRICGLGDMLTAALVGARWGVNARAGQLGALAFGALTNPSEVARGAPPTLAYLFQSAG